MVIVIKIILNSKNLFEIVSLYKMKEKHVKDKKLSKYSFVFWEKIENKNYIKVAKGIFMINWLIKE